MLRVIAAAKKTNDSIDGGKVADSRVLHGINRDS
jgi:hypothetical protein